MPERDSNTYSVARLVRAYAMAGRRDRAVELRNELYDKVKPMSQAAMDDALGDVDSALGKLEAVVDGHNLLACFLKIRRFSPQLRSHPRFQALLKRVGLT